MLSRQLKQRFVSLWAERAEDWPMIWIMKEARTTNQPQPPSGGGTERGRGSTCGAVLSLSVPVGDFSRGGEALTGISLVLRSTLTGSSLSGPAILSQTMSSLLTKKTVIHFQIALSVLLTDKISRRQFPVSFYVKTIAQSQVTWVLQLFPSPRPVM